MKPFLHLHRPRPVQNLMFRRGARNAPEPVRRAARKTLGHGVSPDEAGTIRRIEAMRAELLNDHRQIEYGTVSELCHRSSMEPLWCRFLFHLVRELRPSRCIEMGTCLGISAAYIDSALRLNGEGMLVTIDLFQDRLDIAATHLAALGLNSVALKQGDFCDVLPGVCAALHPNLVFVDGHHDGSATLRYLDMIRPHLAPENAVLFDDIRHSGHMLRAWKTIRARTEAHDFGLMGLCLNVR